MSQAILVIDMIVDFVTGKFGSKEAQNIVPAIKSLLARARKQKIPVIYLKDAHQKDDAELKIWGEHAMKGTEGSEIIEQLSPEEGDIVVEKRFYSGFASTKLEEILKNLNVKELILVGVSTDICVQNNAAEAFFRGYEITVPRDCTASLAKIEHERALEYMQRIYGAKIVDSGEVFQ
ncbi:MAG: isochorismatase family cysteine hydrolase [Methanocellales archaeon]